LARGTVFPFGWAIPGPLTHTEVGNAGFAGAKTCPRPSLALLTTKQHPLPIPYRIQCSFRTARLVAFLGKS